MFHPMNATDFILSSLDLIAKHIPSIGLRYAYDSVTSFHIIEVFPESVRRGCDEYADMERDLWIDFHKQYPEEDLLISEVDKTNDMSNLIYEKNPCPEYVYLCNPSMDFVVKSEHVNLDDYDEYDGLICNEAA